MIGLMPAIVDSIDREARIARVRIPGLTDGAAELPEAEFCNPIGDKSEHTEIRILPGDRVWLAFQHGDTRYPVIVGYRPKNVENGIDWRRFHHAHFEFNADNTFNIIAGTQVNVTAPKVVVDSPDSNFTGKVTIDGLLTYKGGMAGSGGTGGKSATITGSIEVTGGDIKADTISLKNHKHTEQGDGAPTSSAQA